MIKHTSLRFIRLLKADIPNTKKLAASDSDIAYRSCLQGNECEMMKTVDTRPEDHNYVTLFHGSENAIIVPTFGKGEDRHDYGRGFYLTEDKELAREWAVCKPFHQDGYVHQYRLDLTGLTVFDFTEHSALVWLAELMKHRNADNSKRYRVLSEKFIGKYAPDLKDYDMIRGWRANASYFYIAKAFVRDEIDLDILEPLLALGELGMQYCLKSALAFEQLTELKDQMERIPFQEYNQKYNERDMRARERMRELIDSDENRIQKVFSKLL